MLRPDSVAAEDMAAGLPHSVRGIDRSYSDAPYLGGEGHVLWITEPGDSATGQQLLAQEMGRNLGLRMTNTSDNCAIASTDTRTDWPGSTGNIGQVHFDPRPRRFLPSPRLAPITHS